MSEKIKIYRGYLRNTGFSDFPMRIQRDQILKKLEKKYWVEEKYTNHVPVKKESVCQDHRDELTTLLEKVIVNVPIPLLKNGNPDPRKPRIILYWYIDTVNRDGFQDLLYDLIPEEIVMTMDFTLPQEILDGSQFDLIKERRSHLPSLFNMIRDLSRQKFSWRKISGQIESRLGVSLSHVTVGRIINENNLGFVK